MLFEPNFLVLNYQVIRKMDTFKCPICAKSIKDYSNIIKHYQALHNKAMSKEEYMKKLTLPKCSLCDKEVKTLQRHMVLVHNDRSVTDSQSRRNETPKKISGYFISSTPKKSNSKDHFQCSSQKPSHETSTQNTSGLLLQEKRLEHSSPKVKNVTLTSESSPGEKVTPDVSPTSRTEHSKFLWSSPTKSSTPNISPLSRAEQSPSAKSSTTNISPMSSKDFPSASPISPKLNEKSVKSTQSSTPKFATCPDTFPSFSGSSSMSISPRPSQLNASMRTISLSSAASPNLSEKPQMSPKFLDVSIGSRSSQSNVLMRTQSPNSPRFSDASKPSEESISPSLLQSNVSLRTTTLSLNASSNLSVSEKPQMSPKFSDVSEISEKSISLRSPKSNTHIPSPTRQPPILQTPVKTYSKHQTCRTPQTYGTPSPSSIHPHQMRGEPNKSHTEMSKLVIVEHFLTGAYKGYEKYLANNNCQEYCILAVFQKWAEIRNKKSTIETYSSHMKRFFNLHKIPAGEVSFNFLAFNNKEHYIELPPPQAYANDLTQTPPTYKQFSNAYICFLKFLQASISLTPSYLMTDCLNLNKHILETRSTQALEIRNKSEILEKQYNAAPEKQEKLVRTILKIILLLNVKSFTS